MTVLDACRWLKATRLSTLIRQSKWDFAIIEMVHLTALALLGGALVILGLRIFGLILRQHSLDATTRDLKRIIVASLLVMGLSGCLLFTEGPLRYYGNIAFRLKLSLIAAATLCTVAAFRFARVDAALALTPLRLKISTGLSLAFWFGAAVAGRVIGVL